MPKNAWKVWENPDLNFWDKVRVTIAHYALGERLYNVMLLSHMRKTKRLTDIPGGYDAAVRVVKGRIEHGS